MNKKDIKLSKKLVFEEKFNYYDKTLWNELTKVSFSNGICTINAGSQLKLIGFSLSKYKNYMIEFSVNNKNNNRLQFGLKENDNIIFGFSQDIYSTHIYSNGNDYKDLGTNLFSVVNTWKSVKITKALGMNTIEFNGNIYPFPCLESSTFYIEKWYDGSAQIKNFKVYELTNECKIIRRNNQRSISLFIYCILLQR